VFRGSILINELQSSVASLYSYFFKSEDAQIKSAFLFEGSVYSFFEHTDIKLSISNVCLYKLVGQFKAEVHSIKLS